MFFIGCDNAQPVVQSLNLPAVSTPQQVAAALRLANCDPDMIIPVDIQNNQPVLGVILRKGQDYA